MKEIEREKINEDFQMVSPLTQLGLQPFVNIFGDSVIKIGYGVPEMFTDAEAQEFVNDIKLIGMRVKMDEELTFFERTMLRIVFASVQE